MKQIYLGLGTNLGDREENLRKALRMLEDSGVKVVKESEVYESEPFGVKDQPWFLNMAVEVEADLTPFELLAKIKMIEKECGRLKTEKWGPRILDIDILYYGSEVFVSGDLHIPHSGIASRLFVLEPLREIAGDFVDPSVGKTIVELLKACDDKSIVKRAGALN